MCAVFEGIPADAGHVNKGHVKELSAPLRVSAWAPDTCLDTPHLSRESGRKGGQALAAGVAGPMPPQALCLSLSLPMNAVFIIVAYAFVRDAHVHCGPNDQQKMDSSNGNLSPERRLQRIWWGWKATCAHLIEHFSSSSYSSSISSGSSAFYS